MEKYYGAIAIAVLCVLILFIGAMKQKSEALTTFVLRGFVGAVGICVVNEILKSQGVTVAAGINPVTVLTIATLGISGFALIYGILFYHLL
ncbi:transcriptional regulator [Petralouisia muris]|uniref:Transcriptional regulator n=1 Tax=Petralouisia muris TaxID=3032872 RepID=A0AC61RVU5_9FIRM|nr:pro-sigmaK processing inhibitor BofA family protein [Petralouisia muris]TGY96085.1 transcriptional regulator [Petralouisia muris]